MIYPEDNRERNDTIIELRKQGWSYGLTARLRKRVVYRATPSLA